MSMWSYRPPKWIKVGALVMEFLLLLGYMQTVYDRRHPGVPPVTAQCRDGTYSKSRHRSGTCSHHGGVLRWIAR